MSRLRQLAEKFRDKLSGQSGQPPFVRSDTSLETRSISISYTPKMVSGQLSSSDRANKLPDSSDISDASSVADIPDASSVADISSDIGSISRVYFNNNYNINEIACHRQTVRFGQSESAGSPVQAPTLRAELAKFRKTRKHGSPSLRHDQVCWAAEMFLQEWGAMAAEFGWTPDDIFDRDGLACWLGAELVTALGPEHAVTESGRAYDRPCDLRWNRKASSN